MDNNLLYTINELYNEELESKEIYNEEFVYKNTLNQLIDENVQFVNEAYVGKTPTLEKIEEQIGIIRSNLSVYKDFDRLPEVQKLNRLFEEQFGMNVFALHMNKSNIMNAYTSVLACNFDLYKKNLSNFVVADRKNGYKFKPNNKFCVSAVVYYGLLSNPDLTDGEITGIILHEIGHNFADFIDGTIRFSNQNMMDHIIAIKLMNMLMHILSFFGAALIPYDILDLVATRINMDNSIKGKIEERNQRGNQRKIISTIDGICTKILDFRSVVKNILDKYDVVKLITKSISKNIFTKPFEKELKAETINSAGRRNEIIADKFAAIYGYGPELSSGLQKMSAFKTKSELIVDKLPFGKALNRAWEELYIDINEFDCHPHNVQRINECIKTLKDELNQEDMDPKMKNIILAQIKDMENKIKEVKTAIDKDPTDMKKKYDAYVANVLPDGTTKKIEDEINKELNQILKENFTDFEGSVINESSNFHKALFGLRIHPHQDLIETLKKHQYPGYLSFIQKLKSIDDLNYMRQDTYLGINTVKKIREGIAKKDPKVDKYIKNGITVKDCDLSIKWDKEVVLPAISARIKELKSK